jgi:hypothetical protein
MHIDVCTHPLIGKNEANSVVDASGSDLVGVKKQWRNRKTGGIGTGALFSAS